MQSAMTRACVLNFRRGISPAPVNRLFGAVTFFCLLAVSSATAATLTVYNTNDSAARSLRQAIADAAAGDTIVFDIPTSDPHYDSTTKTYTITLTTAELLITRDVTIDGRGQKIAISCGGKFRQFEIQSATVTIRGLTLRDGYARADPTPGAGTIAGGILNTGNLTLIGCTFTNELSSGDCAAVCSSGTLTMVNCTVADNTTETGGVVKTLAQ